MMMKKRIIGKARVGVTYARFFMNFKIYYFSMKPKQRKTFSWGYLCPIYFKSWEFELFYQFFFWQFFFVNILNIER